VTASGRGDPALTDPVTGTHAQRQGSISSSELRGLKRARPRGPWRGLVFLVVLMVVIVVGGGLLAGPRLRDAAYDLARSNPQVMRLPMVPDVVRERLGATLTTPVSTRGTPVKFTVGGSDSVREIGRALQDQGLITDALAFTYLAVTEGVDGKLHTGTFNLAPSMTPQEIVTRLQSAPDPVTRQVLLNLRPGLRLEQIAAYLQTLPLDMEAADFYALVTEPPDWVRTEFPWLKELPAGNSLEGFMGLGLVRVDANIAAEDLVRTLLTRWETDIGPAVIADVKSSGQDFYDVLKLASIVERETAVDSERPKVAGVYTNRLKGLGGTRLLNAEPTVIYANDGTKLRKQAFTKWPKYRFWGLTGFADLSKVKVAPDLMGYQSWFTEGLPPTPIDSPTLSSIRAAANPDTKAGNLYFYACKGSQTHLFSKTLAGQRKNINSCAK
jgi:UPF0755 protein